MVKKAAKPKKDTLNSPDELAQAGAYFKENASLLSPPVMRAAYSDRMAWVCASMAHLAYDPFEAEDRKAYWLLAAKLKGGGFRLLGTFNSRETDTQAFLAANDEYAVLAFRGTEKDWRDIQTDIRAKRVTTPEGKVHAGFNAGYASVAKQIEKALLRVEGYPLFITGHSLGGALATVATQMLESNPKFAYQIAACYTFGSPRVGNADYDEHIKSSFYRVVNTTDIVTVVPLLTMGFVHIGDVRFLEREDKKFRRSIPTLRRLWAFLTAFSRLVTDHKIVEYRRKMGKIAEHRNPGTESDSRMHSR